MFYQPSLGFNELNCDTLRGVASIIAQVCYSVHEIMLTIVPSSEYR